MIPPSLSFGEKDMTYIDDVKAVEAEVTRITEEALAEGRERKEAMDAGKKIQEQQKLILYNTLTRKCTTATLIDYAKWLFGYLAQGGKIDAIAQFHQKNDLIMKLNRNAEVTPTGAIQVPRIIVPEGLNLESPEGLGDLVLYFMEDFSVRTEETLRRPKVLLYDDIRPILKMMAQDRITEKLNGG